MVKKKKVWWSQRVRVRIRVRVEIRIKVILRSHLERGLAEFVALKIWASSESLPGFGRALCDNHIQIGRLAYVFRTEVGPSPSELWLTLASRWLSALPICRISSWPRVVNAISSAGHLQALAEGMFHGKVRARWRHSAGPALLGGELPEMCKIAGKARSYLSLPESAMRNEQFLNFDRGLRRSPHELTASSPDLPVFLVTQATFTYSF